MIDEHESNDISQSRRKGPFLGEKGPIIWQSRFKVVLLEVAFYVKAGLCRSQLINGTPEIPILDQTELSSPCFTLGSGKLLTSRLRLTVDI